MSIKIHVPDHILYEDDYIIVLNKPCSLMVEPDRNGHPNLLHQVRQYLKCSAINGEVYGQHIHRLDRPVSGIVLFAKQKAVLKNLSEQFAERKVKKYYQALTVNIPTNRHGNLEHWHHKQNKLAIINNEELPGTEKVVLKYDVAAITENKYLWSIELHTGKYHQIRAQLSFVGCPIIGDHLYGSPIAYRPDAIALHACKLVFLHPTTNKEMDIVNQITFDR